MAVHAAPADSLSDTNPIRGAIAGSRKAGRVDESFQQHGLVALVALPVDGQLSRCLREDGGGKPVDLDPWKHQETAVINDVL